MLSADNALRQANMTAAEYADHAIENLCKALGIDMTAADWRQQLAPFASVLAAMITAAAADYDTAMRGGVISSASPRMTVYNYGSKEAVE